MTDLAPRNTPATGRERGRIYGTGRSKALTAAAVKIPLDDSKLITKLIQKRQEWQRDAWGYYDEIPEVKFAINYLANGIGKVTFYAAIRNAEGEIVPVDAPDRDGEPGTGSPIAGTPLALAAVAEMARLRAPTGGQGELNRMVEANIEVAGECYLHGQDEKTQQGIAGDADYQPFQPETWDVRSVSEIEATGKKKPNGQPEVLVKASPEDRGRALDDATEGLIRLWQRHPQWSAKPDCHMRGLINDLEGLALMTAQQKAESKSRLSAPLVLVPVELGLTDQPTPTNPADPDAPDEGGDPVEQGAQQNGLLEAITEFATTPIEDPNDVASLVGLIISGQGQWLDSKYFRTLDLARPPDLTLDVKIEKKIDRTARGLNVPVEVVMGHMSTTFSNAEQISQDVYDDHFEPRVSWLGEAYTTGFLVPNLKSQFAGIDDVIEQIFAWADVSGLVSGGEDVDPDEAYAKGLIGDAAYRRMKGIPEEDAPTPEEWARNLGARRGILTAELTTALLKMGGVELGPVAPPPPGPGQEGAAGASALGSRREFLDLAILTAAARANPGAQLAAIDRSLFNRLAGAAEGAMDRALERAGNRLRTNNQLRPKLRGLQDMRWAANELGPQAITAAGVTSGELLEDAWTALQEQFGAWVESAGEDALAIVEEITGGIPRARRAELQLRLLENRDEAWRWLQTNLTDTAVTRLFDPEVIAAAEELGEVALSSRVPPGLVREALARAGGASLRGAAGITAPVTDHPVGGIATGEEVLGYLAEAGASIDAYRWVYGPARRKTFEPHQALDGVTFTNFDDAVLANSEGWPDTPYYFPGDHQGCVCDFEPIVIPPKEQ